MTFCRKEISIQYYPTITPTPTPTPTPISNGYLRPHTRRPQITCSVWPNVCMCEMYGFTGWEGEAGRDCNAEE